MLADNKLAQNAGWDRNVLALELAELQIALPEFSLDLGITGFEPGEVESIIEDAAEERADPSDEVPEFQASVTARIGDLFVLDQHRLIVGDTQDLQTFASLMQSDLAEMAFLDPPYNVPINGYAQCYYPAINLASLAVMSTAPNSAFPQSARDFAEQAIQYCGKCQPTTHWSYATEGEAALILGDLDRAEMFYQKAKSKTSSPRDLDSMYSQAIRVAGLVHGDSGAQRIERLFGVPNA